MRKERDRGGWMHHGAAGRTPAQRAPYTPSVASRSQHDGGEVAPPGDHGLHLRRNARPRHDAFHGPARPPHSPLAPHMAYIAPPRTKAARSEPPVDIAGAAGCAPS